MRPLAALSLLLGLFVLLGAVYVAKTPYREPGMLRYQGGVQVPDVGAPDERQHANYVAHLLDGKGFPVLRPGSPDLIETYQSHQPPLYYVIAAGWAKLTGADPHGESGRRIRYLNLLFGLGTLLGVFYAARWGLGRDDIGLAAVALAGLMPMFVALHAAVSNDPLLFLLCTWTVALCARGLRFGWGWKVALLCGVFVGLGLLTKTTALALVPTVGVALLAGMKLGAKRPGIGAWALALALPFLIGLPWMARNQNLYGDPFAIKAFTEAFVGSPQPHHVAIPGRLVAEDPVYWEAANKLLEQEPGLQGRELIDRLNAEVGMTGAARADYWTDWVGWWTARSYIGVFGYMDIFLMESRDSTETSDTTYRLILALLGVAAVGWLFHVRSGLDAQAKAFHLVQGTLLLVVVVLFVRFNLQYFQGQARYLYPAVSAISIGLGAGLCQLMGRRKDVAWVVAGVFLAIVQALALQAIERGFADRTLAGP